jgi:hypothetical protein
MTNQTDRIEKTGVTLTYEAASMLRKLSYRLSDKSDERVTLSEAMEYACRLAFKDLNSGDSE